MALSLSAEQKNLRSLFINDDRYVVPSFQRPYRWTKKETKQFVDFIFGAEMIKVPDIETGFDGKGPVVRASE